MQEPKYEDLDFVNGGTLSGTSTSTSAGNTTETASGTSTSRQLQSQIMQIEGSWRTDTSSSASSIYDVSSILTLVIIASPLSEIYPTPYEQATSLNSEYSKNQMRQKFSSFDTTYNITAIEYSKYSSYFSVPPALMNTSYSNMTFNFKLDSYGWVFAIAVRDIEDFGKPTPYQIYKGLNYKNIPTVKNFVEVDKKYTYFDISIHGLFSASLYNVYVTTGSAHPGYPDLLIDNYTATFSFETLKVPDVPKLSLNKSWVVVCQFLILVFLIILCQ